jgi:PASTA domain-containing protein
MAGSIVQSRASSNSSAASSIALAFSTNNAANNKLFVASLAQGAAPGLTIADSLTNSYTSLNSITDVVTFSRTVASWEVITSKVGANTVTVSNTITAVKTAIYIAEIGGVQNVAADKKAAQTQLAPGTATDAVTTGSVSTTTTDFCIALSYQNLTAGDVPITGTGFTTDLTSIWFANQAATEFKSGVAPGTVAATFTSPGATDDFFTLAAWFTETIALVGRVGTSGTGVLAPATALALTGTSGTGSVGSLTAAFSVALAGVTGTGSVGTVSPSSSSTIALTGVSGTGGIGTLAPAADTALTGIAGTTSTGTVSLAFSVALTGVSATGSVGALTALLGVSGVTGTGSVGTISPALTVALTGVTGTGGTGTVIPIQGLSLPLTGVRATGSVGTLAIGKVFVPTVTQLSEATAIVELNALGLLVAIGGFTPSLSPAGTVVLQSPAAGQLVAQGSTVTLTLSSGPASPVTPPPVRVQQPVALPNRILPQTVPFVNPKGLTNVNWWTFLLNVSNQALGVNSPAEVTQTVGASPWTFTATIQGSVLVSGGPVTLIGYSHNGSVFYPTGQTGGIFQLSPGDQLQITYTNAPAVTFFPR